MVRQLVRRAKVRETISSFTTRAELSILPYSPRFGPSFRMFALCSGNARGASTHEPHYGDYRGLEGRNGWRRQLLRHQNEYYDAKLIPKQIKDATYLVNVALLKAHSYPYSSQEGGDEGQTGVTMTARITSARSKARLSCMERSIPTARHTARIFADCRLGRLAQSRCQDDPVHAGWLLLRSAASILSTAFPERAI